MQCHQPGEGTWHRHCASLMYSLNQRKPKHWYWRYLYNIFSQARRIWRQGGGRGEIGLGFVGCWGELCEVICPIKVFWTAHIKISWVKYAGVKCWRYTCIHSQGINCRPALLLLAFIAFYSITVKAIFVHRQKSTNIKINNYLYIIIWIGNTPFHIQVGDWGKTVIRTAKEHYRQAECDISWPKLIPPWS